MPNQQRGRNPQQRRPKGATNSGRQGAANQSVRQPAQAPTQPTSQVIPTSATSNRPAAAKATAGVAAGATAGAGVARLRQGRQPVAQNRRRYAREPWWRRNLFALITVGAVVVLIAGYIIYTQSQNRAAAVGVGDAAPASVLSEVTGVTPTVAAKVGTGGVPISLLATPKNTALLTANGKPKIVYVGADWCPYCAATRWSTVVALSRFGSFSGLTLMRSSSGDVYPNTATFSFQNATYTSAYITFSPTETADRNQQPLATPSPEDAQVFSMYDTAPYTNSAGGIPFLSYGNQYLTTSTLYVPTMLQGLDWQQIASQLNNPSSQVTQAIVGGANQQTAAICKLTNNQPGAVCNASYIQQIEAQLPQAK